MGTLNFFLNRSTKYLFDSQWECCNEMQWENFTIFKFFLEKHFIWFDGSTFGIEKFNWAARALARDDFT